MIVFATIFISILTNDLDMDLSTLSSSLNYVLFMMSQISTMESIYSLYINNIKAL